MQHAFLRSNFEFKELVGWIEELWYEVIQQKQVLLQLKTETVALKLQMI